MVSSIPSKRLYREYKSLTERLDWNHQVKYIDIKSLSVDGLYEHARELLSVYNTFSKCYQKRIEFRDKYITEYERDEGHEYMLAKIKEEIHLYEQLLGDTFSCIESIPEIQPTTIVNDTPSHEVVATVTKKPKKKAKKKPFNQQLKEAGIDISTINREISLQTCAKELRDEIVTDVDRCNINRLLKRAHKNPYIWQIAISHAQEENNIRVMMDSYEHVRYLSDKYPYLKEVVNKIEVIFILHGYSRIVDHTDAPLLVIPDGQESIRIHPFIKYIIRGGSNKARMNMLQDILEYIRQEYRYIRNINIMQVVINFEKEMIPMDDDMCNLVNELYRQILNLAIIHNMIVRSLSCNILTTLFEVFHALLPHYIENLVQHQRLSKYTDDELREELAYTDKIPKLFKGIYREFGKFTDSPLKIAANALNEELKRRE